MMTFPTVKEVIATRDILMRVAQRELPFKTSIKIQRFLDNTDIIYTDFKKVEQELVDKYIDKDHHIENTMFFAFKEGGEEEFNKQMDELMNTQLKYVFDIDNYFVDDDLKELEFTPDDLFYMKWMIKDIGGGNDGNW